MFAMSGYSRLHVLAVSGLAATTALAALAASPAPNKSASPNPAARLEAVNNYGKLPLSFEANQGQVDSRVKFLSRGNGYSLFLTNRAAVLSLSKPPESRPAPEGSPVLKDSPALKGDGFSRREQGQFEKGASAPEGTSPKTDTIQMQVLGANPNARVEAADRLPGVSNYFLGNDQSKWRTNIPTYAKVR